jgi:hypothetical protein
VQRIAVSAARDRHRVRTYGRYIHMRTYTHLHVNPTDYITLYIDIFAYIYSIFSDAQPYIHTWTPAQASAYTCVRTRASAVPPRRIEDRPSASAAVARRRPKSGAYIVQCGDRRGVPRADVCVECLRPGKRLRAEPHAVVHAGGKDSHVWARIRAQTWARMWGTHASVIRSSMSLCAWI